MSYPVSPQSANMGMLLRSLQVWGEAFKLLSDGPLIGLRDVKNIPHGVETGNM